MCSHTVISRSKIETSTEERAIDRKRELALSFYGSDLTNPLPDMSLPVVFSVSTKPMVFDKLWGWIPWLTVQQVRRNVNRLRWTHSLSHDRDHTKRHRGIPVIATGCMLSCQILHPFVPTHVDTAVKIARNVRRYLCWTIDTSRTATHCQGN